MSRRRAAAAAASASGRPGTAAVVSWVPLRGYFRTEGRYADYGAAEEAAAKFHRETYPGTVPPSFVHFLPVDVEHFEEKHGELPPENEHEEQD